MPYGDGSFEIKNSKYLGLDVIEDIIQYSKSQSKTRHVTISVTDEDGRLIRVKRSLKLTNDEVESMLNGIDSFATEIYDEMKDD